MSLYRKYRPQTFSEIVGQEKVVDSLLKQLESGKITHAYLFSGPRGTGKTSIARIFAKSINCKKYSGDKFGEPCDKCENCLSITNGSYMDVLEIDAASNRGIDEIRDLREKIRLAPTVGRYKVYIIDEAHMLTTEAFNALLKTLEEPPEHAIFILATTESHKIPATILSRTQKFEFGLSDKVVEKLQKITEAKGLPQEGLDLISRLSGGSFRDGEVLLEKVIAVNPKATIEEVESILGGKRVSGVYPFDLFLYKKTKEAIVWLEEFGSSGGSYKYLGESLLEVLRDILLIKVGALTETGKDYSGKDFKELEAFSNQIPKEKLTNWIKIFTSALSEMKDSPIPSLPLELAIIEACEFEDGVREPDLSNNDLEIQKEKAVTKETKDQLKETEPKVVVVEEIQVIETPFVTIESKGKPIKKATKGTFSVTEIQNNWDQITKKVKEKNSSLGVFLRSALPHSLEEDLLNLEVSYQFHKDRLEEPKNSLLLSTIIEEILGKPVRIKGTVGEKKIKLKKAEQIEEVDPVEIFGKLV